MAAGLGFKTFTTGEVLTAADVNGYLMQGILVFASEAARNSAITSPQEGQFAFTKDNNSLWYYTGSAWVASGATGDIEGVTAGVGISGGGTSGTVTITNDMATTITAAGDIVLGTGSGTYDNLPIGTTGQVLTADTTVSPYKIKWATPASGTTFAGCKLKKSAAQSIANGTNTYVTWDQEYFDSDNYHDNTTNNTRITIPAGKGGKYLVFFTMSWGNNATGYRYADTMVNGVAAGGGSTLNVVMPTTGYSGGTDSTVVNLNAGDYVELLVYQNSGGNLNFNSGTDTAFGVAYLGA